MTPPDPFDNSLDGDGYVLYAQALRHHEAMPWHIRMTINSGCHATTLEMTSDELAETIALLGRAQLALEAYRGGLFSTVAPVTPADIKAGDLITTDGGFGCCAVGPHRVQADDTGRLYFACDEGRHHLDGTVDDNPEGACVGVSLLVAGEPA